MYTAKVPKVFSIFSILLGILLKKPLIIPQICSRKQSIYRTNFKKLFFIKSLSNVFSKLVSILNDRKLFWRTVSKQAHSSFCLETKRGDKINLIEHVLDNKS